MSERCDICGAEKKCVACMGKKGGCAKVAKGFAKVPYKRKRKAKEPSYTKDAPIVPAEDRFESCDYCASMEPHYCLLHSRQMKNMDTVRCCDWMPKEPKP
jgi:hypothetical protein